MRHISYTVKEIGVIQKTPNHIPYIGYVTLCGPRGGLYLLDLYNIEQLLIQNGIRLRTNTTEYLISYGNRMGRNRIITGRDFSDDDFKTIAEKLGIPSGHVLKRKNNNKFYQLKRGFQINDPDIKQYTI